jgi:hypothetical protein
VKRVNEGIDSYSCFYDSRGLTQSHRNWAGKRKEKRLPFIEPPHYATMFVHFETKLYLKIKFLIKSSQTILRATHRQSDWRKVSDWRKSEVLKLRLLKMIRQQSTVHLHGIPEMPSQQTFKKEAARESLEQKK